MELLFLKHTVSRVTWKSMLLQELRKREDMVAKREGLLDEKSELEMKKLRSSQVVNKVCRQKLIHLLTMTKYLVDY